MSNIVPISLTSTEENYLKCIYKIYLINESEVSTNQISVKMNTSAASVTDMLRKLSEKRLIHYQKYKGVTLTMLGQNRAIQLVRKHRLWESFLVDKLNYSWDEDHEIAEQLEHIESETLISKLDEFLGFPTVDPHGDPIPTSEGVIYERLETLLSEAPLNKELSVLGVIDHSSPFLQYLDARNLKLGQSITKLKEFEFDKSIIVLINKDEITISHKVASNIRVGE
jgi:DtxR family Mn-dependent transcriptional regulator